MAAVCDFSDLPADQCDHCGAQAAEDPAARIAKRRAVIAMAVELMTHHGLFRRDWTFAFDNPKRRVGQCNHEDRRITVSGPWADVLPMDTIRNVLLHEIAHALVGPGHGHGQVWASQARAIGCTATRCTNVGDYRIGTPAWSSQCHSCSATHEQHRAPLRVRSCSSCGHGRFNPNFVLQWRREGVAQPRTAMPKRFQAELNEIERKYNVRAAF